MKSKCPNKYDHINRPDNVLGLSRGSGERAHRRTTLVALSLVVTAAHQSSVSIRVCLNHCVCGLVTGILLCGACCPQCALDLAVAYHGCKLQCSPTMPFLNIECSTSQNECVDDIDVSCARCMYQCISTIRILN